MPLLFPTTSAEGIRKKTPSGKCVVFFLPPPISHHVHAQASGKIASRKIVCSCDFFGETPSQNTPKVIGFLGSHKKPMPISDAEATYVLRQILLLFSLWSTLFADGFAGAVGSTGKSPHSVSILAPTARTMMLVYDLPATDAIYQRFVGIDGSAYFVGGLGMTALMFNNVVVVPIRSGVGVPRPRKVRRIGDADRRGDRYPPANRKERHVFELIRCADCEI